MPPDALAGRPFDVVINATSAGLSADAAWPWPNGLFASGAFAYDMVYGDAPTAFLRWAGAQGVARSRFGVSHTTFQLESGALPDCPSC